MQSERLFFRLFWRALFFAGAMGLFFMAGDADAQDNRKPRVSRRGQAESDAPPPSKSSRRSARRNKPKTFLRSPSPRPSGDRATAPIPGTRRAEPRPRTGDRPDPARQSTISNPSTGRDTRDRPYRANVSVTGRRLPPRRPQTRAAAIYGQGGPLVNNIRSTPDRSERLSPIRLPSSGLGNRQGPVGPKLARQGMSYTRRLPESRSSSYQANRVQRRLFVNNPSAQPFRREAKAAPVRNSGFVSGSTPFMKRLRRDPYWGKTTPDRSRKETDIAGRPLRRRDYRSVVQTNPSTDSVRNAPRRVDRRPTTSASVNKGIRSATETGSAWSGDISGRRIGEPRASASQGQGQSLPRGGEGARIRGLRRNASIAAVFGSARSQGTFRGPAVRGGGGMTMRQNRISAGANPFRKGGQFRSYTGNATLPSGIVGNIDLRFRAVNTNRMRQFGRSRPAGLGAFGGITGGRSLTGKGGAPGRQARSAFSRSGRNQNYRKTVAGLFEPFNSGSTLPSGLVGKVDLRVKRANPEKAGRNRGASGAQAGSGTGLPGGFRRSAGISRRNPGGLANRETGQRSSRPNLSVPKGGEFKPFRAGSTLPSGFTGIVDLRVNRSSPENVGRNRNAFRGLSAGANAGSRSTDFRRGKYSRPDLSVPKAGEFKSFRAGSTLPSGLTGIVDLRLKRSSPENVGRNRNAIRGLSAGANAGIRSTDFRRGKSSRPDLSVPKAGEFKSFRAGSTLPSGLTGIVDLRTKKSSPDKVGRSRVSTSGRIKGMEVRGTLPSFRPSRAPGTYAGNQRMSGRNRADAGGLVNRQAGRRASRPDLSVPKAGEFKSFRAGSTLPSGLTGIVDLRTNKSSPDKVGRSRVSTSGRIKGMEVRGTLPSFRPSRALGTFAGNQRTGGRNRADAGGLVNRQAGRKASRPDLSVPKAGEFKSFKAGSTLPSGLTGIVDLRVRRTSPANAGRYRTPSNRQVRQFEVRGQAPNFPRSTAPGKFSGNLKGGDSRVDVGGVVNRQSGRKASRPDLSVPKAGEFKSFKAGSTLPSGLTGIVDLRVRRTSPDNAGRYRTPSNRQVRQFEVRGQAPNFPRSTAIGKYQGNLKPRGAPTDVGGIVNRQPERTADRPVFRITGGVRPALGGDPDRSGLYRSAPNRQVRQFEVRGRVPDFPRSTAIGKYQGNLKPGGAPADVGGIVNGQAGRKATRSDLSVPKAGEFKSFKAGSTLPSGLTGVVDLRVRRTSPDKAGRYRMPADVQVRRFEVRGRLPESDRNKDAGKFSGNVPVKTSKLVAIIKGIDATGNYSGNNRVGRAVYANVGGVVNRQKAVSETSGARSVDRAGQSFRRSEPSGNMSRIASFQGAQPVFKSGAGKFHTPTLVKLVRGDFRGGLVRERNGNREDRIIAGYADKEFKNPFRNDWMSGPNTVPGALRKRRPDPDLFLVSGLRATIRYPENLRRRMNEQALRDAKITASAKEKPGSKDQVPAKDYVTSPSGTKGALKVEEPNRKLIRSGMIQADFSHQSRNASENGKGATGIRQLWNRFFGKAEGGKGNGKVQKPKYDPKEIGLWYD